MTRLDDIGEEVHQLENSKMIIKLLARLEQPLKSMNKHIKKCYNHNQKFGIDSN